MAPQDGNVVEFIAVTALSLAVPRAILAIDDLAKRLATKKKVDPMLETVKRKTVSSRETTVKIQYPDGTTKEVKTINTEKILLWSKRENNNDVAHCRI
jgi:hypothetical protein